MNEIGYNKIIDSFELFYLENHGQNVLFLIIFSINSRLVTGICLYCSPGGSDNAST